MLKTNNAYSYAQVPYITYEALEVYAESIIGDYSPEMLITPGMIDIPGLVRDYLGLRVIFHRLSYDSKIAGITVFGNDYIQIWDKQAASVIPIPIEAGTVVIDSSLRCTRNQPRMRFTLGHEGSHWLLHQRAFSRDNPGNNAGIGVNNSLAAKTGAIKYSRGIWQTESEKKRMEHQADFLSAALLMPRPVLWVAYRSFFSRLGESPRLLIRGKGSSDDGTAKQLSAYIAAVFGVSNHAAMIRLEKLKAIEYRGVRR